VTRSAGSRDGDPGDARILPFDVAELHDGSTVRVLLRGELDMATRPRVERALRRAEDSGAAMIELDLGGLTFMDSSGVHVASEAHERARRKGHTLLVLEASERIQRIFEVTGSGHLLSCRQEAGGTHCV
jgi:anti-sigma B factor antagonist